jgi:hypothetical protein
MWRIRCQELAQALHFRGSVNTMSTVDALPTAKRDVVYRAVAEGALLFSVRDEVYFALNASGAYIWEALPPVLRTVDELCSRLEARYPDVDPATLRADAVELLEELATYGLVERQKPEDL